MVPPSVHVRVSDPISAVRAGFHISVIIPPSVWLDGAHTAVSVDALLLFPLPPPAPHSHEEETIPRGVSTDACVLLKLAQIDRPNLELDDVAAPSWN